MRIWSKTGEKVRFLLQEERNGILLGAVDLLQPSGVSMGVPIAAPFDRNDLGRTEEWFRKNGWEVEERPNV